MKRKKVIISFFIIAAALAAMMLLKGKSYLLNGQKMKRPPKDATLIGEEAKILPVVIYDER